MNSISVIICAYTEKRWDDLVASLESIELQTLQPMEVIVVIDHNNHLFERAKSRFLDVRVIENQEAQGLSGARNSGVAVAKGDLIAFMDEDAMAAQNWLSELSVHYRDVMVMGVGGSIEPKWIAKKPNWFPDEFKWVVGCTYKGMPETAVPIRNMIGCNMSFRRDVFEKVGGFRSNMGRIGTIPLGCEETELCIRVKQYWPTRLLIYEPLAKVYHRVPDIRVRFSYFRARCYAEGLSKALVSHFVGSADALSSERRYTFRTLPEGALQGLSDFFLGEWAGLGRTVAIVIGFALTAIGYLVGLVSQMKDK